MNAKQSERLAFDASGRFVISDYAAARPFSSFLPGIAGPLGIPMWVFYVNRGQAITSFGVESKDKAIVEFQPANKAYQLTPLTGFRTFLKLRRDGETALHEPFAPWSRSAGARRQMFIGMNELELQEGHAGWGLQTNVLYFTLPGERIAGLVRQVTLRNTGDRPLAIEMLDGLPALIPYGVTNEALKTVGRTIEAWMEVFNVERRIPFYRLRASAQDTAAVEAIAAGHFALAFVERGGQAWLLPPFVDPEAIFGRNTSLQAPDRFAAHPLATLQQQRQISGGKTPCAFFGAAATLAPAESVTLTGIFGHAGSLHTLDQQHERLLDRSYIEQKRQEALALAQRLTEPIATQTSSPRFDAYCRQTFLDNVLRGGWPVLLGDEARPHVYHIYSRKHGDPERDYNAFFLAAEHYSQGNGNYRDVNQNRRNDVLFQPQAGAFNVHTFMSLLQADGYNPLVVQGSRFTLPPDRQAALLAHVVQPQRLAPLLAQPFSPGQLLKFIDDHQIELRTDPHALLALALQDAEQHVTAAFGEGFWIDHWTYNLDLIENYLAVYPDQEATLLFETRLPFFDSPVVVRPRAEKYVLAGGQPRQLHAVHEDEEKAALIASRAQSPNWMRTERGQGQIYRATLYEKLLCLALNKLSALDSCGMGVEMEAGKPGWCDALNGLPGLFGSSLAETFELQRLVAFLLAAAARYGDRTARLPVEVDDFLQAVTAQLSVYRVSADPQRDLACWDALTTAREAYRQRIRLGFDGATRSLTLADLQAALGLFAEKVQAGIARAAGRNGDLPPTYFAGRPQAYEILRDAEGEPLADAEGRPRVAVQRFSSVALPLFLEGPVRAMKVQPDRAAARRLYRQVRASELFDRKLGLYRLNASLADQPHDIGRARAFTPGWLENESIWLHMAYKYLLEVLKAGLYEEFFADFGRALIPFHDPAVYGRSPLENSSFLVSSAHPDESLHGAGFVARLTGATAEFLSIWSLMMAGPRPFFLQDGQLCLALKPALPGWLFTAAGTVRFPFLGRCTVTYHNPTRRNTFDDAVSVERIVLRLASGPRSEVEGAVIGPPYAALVRSGQVDSIDLFLA